MLRFFSKRYSNKRKNKLGLKISNPILMQDGEANYPAALLNLSTTIPVQRPDSERNLPGSMHGLDANYLQEYHPVTIGNDQNKHFTNIATNNQNQNLKKDKDCKSKFLGDAIKTNNSKPVAEGGIERFSKNGSNTDLIVNGESNLHVFHHVRPPRNVIQCRVEMLDGAFYHVQLPVSLTYFTHVKY